MEAKETEEQTWIRINEENKSLNSFEIAKLYNSEMLKSSLPTEEEIIGRSKKQEAIGFVNYTKAYKAVMMDDIYGWMDLFTAEFFTASELYTKYKNEDGKA